MCTTELVMYTSILQPTAAVDCKVKKVADVTVQPDRGLKH